MPGETVVPPAGAPMAMEAPPIVAPGTGAPPATAAPAPAGGDEGGRTVVLPSKALSRIKTEARERGRKEALAEFAKQQGFESLEQFTASLHAGPGGPAPRNGGGGGQGRAGGRGGGGGVGGGGGRQAAPQGGAPVPPARPGRDADRAEWRKYEHAKAAFEKDRDSYRRRIAAESNRRRELQRQLDAKDAEMVLRETAVLAGVRDVDYAMRLLTRHLEGRSEDELKSFEERKFFEGLRATHPYLFGETVVPANTGTSGAVPAPKPPGAAAAAAAREGQFDAMADTDMESSDPKTGVRIIRKVKPDVNARLRKLGLNPLGL